MAKLKSIGKTLLFNLSLYTDPDSYDWVTYKIIINLVDDQTIKPLVYLSGPGLFFEAAYEPEVPAICNGILDVINGRSSRFFFEPIDEKDFQLELRKTERGHLLINIYSNYFTAVGNYNWPSCLYIGLKMYVQKEDLLEFVKQLRIEYEQIESKFPGRTFLPKDRKNS